MAFVTGRLCSQCKVFVVDNDKQHICLKSIKNIPKKNFSTKNLFDDLSDEESIAETSIQSDKPNISISSKVTKNSGVSKEDVPILIATIETSKPLWDHRLSLGERSENIKNNMWNEVYVQFNVPGSILERGIHGKKKSSDSGSVGGNKKLWEHFKSLQFLDDVLLVNKHTTYNISSINESAPSLKRSKKTTIENYMGCLIDELKNSRPITPTEPVLLTPEPPNEDHTFSLYLTNIMSGIPKKSKIRLQGKLIALVIEELNK